MRIGVITPTPTPYRDPFWNEVARQPDVELDVYYCSAGTKDRPWDVSWSLDFRAEVLPGRNLAAWRGMDGYCFWNPGLRRRLRDGRYDALIFGGYNHVTMLSGIRYAIRHRIPYFLMNEVYLAQPRRWWRRVIKGMPLRYIVRNATGFFPTGTLAAEYLEHYGASARDMCPCPNVPDVDAYWRLALELSRERSALRAEAGLGEEPVVLFVGRLIPLKQVDTLLRAFSSVVKGRPARLVVLGDGPIRPELESLAAALGIAEQVCFRGFLAPEELPKWYAMSDLFVLPSSDETWSVVVLEALASGLPVVVTKLVGCYADVVVNPAVGTVVPPCDATALAAAMAGRLDCTISREKVAEAWAPVREKMRYPVLAEQMVKTLRRAVGQADAPVVSNRPGRRLSPTIGG